MEQERLNFAAKFFCHKDSKTQRERKDYYCSLRLFALEAERKVKYQLKIDV